MNLTIPKTSLVRLASRMSNIAERKSTMPVLSNVLLQANGTGLGLSATDLYLALAGGAGAEIKKPGSVAVPAKDFYERIQKMPDGPIHLDARDSGLVMKSTVSQLRYTLRSMPGEDFPPMPRPSESEPLSIDAGTLSTLISRTVFAACTDETRAQMNGALIEWEDDAVRMIAVDGHRLAKVERKLPAKGVPREMLLQLKAVHELKKIADEVYSATGDGPKTISIVPSGSHAFFVAAGLTFGCKLVDAVFPPYRQVTPKSWNHELKVNRGALLESVKAVAISSDEKTNGIKVALTSGLMTLHGRSVAGGDGEDELSCEYSGPNMSVGFRASYLADVLTALTCEEITIGLSGELDPIVIKPIGDAHPNDVYVVMPMRI